MNPELVGDLDDDDKLRQLTALVFDRYVKPGGGMAMELTGYLREAVDKEFTRRDSGVDQIQALHAYLNAHLHSVNMCLPPNCLTESLGALSLRR